MERALAYALARGYTVYTSPLQEDWRLSIAGLTEALLLALPQGLAGVELGPDIEHGADPTTRFAVEQAGRHRARGVDIGMFLGLLAYYRQSYLDLLEASEQPAGQKAEGLRFVSRFFDRLATCVAVAWNATGETAKLEELRGEALETQNEMHRLTAVFQTLPTPVLLTDARGGITYLNDTARNWLARSLTEAPQEGETPAAEQFIGREVTELLPWVAPALARVRSGFGHEQGELGRVDTGEKLAFLDTRVYPLFDITGRFDGMVVVLQDITALRDASESQARIASELRGQLREASSLNRLADVLGQNAASAEELLQNVAEALPRCWDAPETLTARISFDNQEYHSSHGPAQDICGRIMEEPISVMGQLRGAIRLCCTETVPAFSPGEAPMLAAMARQVEHVLETRLSLSLLGQSERQFREFFDSAADAIFIHDEDGRILDANKNAGLWLNTPTENLSGKSLLESVAEGEREAVSSRFLNALRGEPELFQTTLQRRDGFAIPAEFLCQVQNYQGRAALISTGRNITSRLRAQAEIERRLEMEALISGISARLINSADEDMPLAIGDSLSDLCRFLDMQRGTVFLLDGKKTGLVRAYQRSDAAEAGASTPLRRIGRGKMPWFTERVLKAERVNIRDAGHMPPAGRKDKVLLAQLGIASFAAVPMTVKGRLLGVLTVASSTVQDTARMAGSRVLEQVSLLFSNAIERRRTAMALRRSESLATSIIESLSANICVLDRTGTVTMVNRQWRSFAKENTPPGEKLFGIGADYLAICREAAKGGEALAAQAAEGIRSVLSGKSTVFQMEYPCHSPTEKRWFILQVTPFVGMRKGGAVVSHRDITERIQAITEMRESEERFRIIVETAQEAVMNLNADARVTYANPRASTLFGYTHEELLGASIFDLVDTLDHPLLRQNIERRRKGISSRYELRFRHKNGHRLWTMLNASAMQNEDGTFAGSVGMITDMSDRVRAEMRLRRNEARYRSLVESMHEGLIMARKNGIVTYVNDRFCAMLGRARGEITGHRVSELADDASKGRLEQMLAESQNGKLKDRGGSEEIIWEHAAGRHIYSLVSPSAYADEEGKVAGFFAVITDTTDRKGLESQLLQSQKLEAIGQLAAGIAHEINTPAQYVGNNTQFIKGAFEDILQVIEAVRGLITLSKTACPGQEDIRALEKVMEERDMEYLAAEVPGAIAQTLEGVERISTIVRSVKQFAHPGLAVMAPADLNESMKSTATVSRNEWKYVAELELDLDPELPLVVCMIGEINQVVLNLIINAAHAIADAKKQNPEREGRITLTTKQAAPWAEIRVRDTGTGIPPAVQAKIFDPFFTTKEVGRGTGQGLTISRGIVVEKHKGQLFFETTEGVGTTFVVRLPLEQAEQSEGS